MAAGLRKRQDWQKLEDSWLSPYACRSRHAHATRLYEEPEHPYRTAFQRDRDRIVHSRAFRRLKHKRQVFLTTEGDHFRTRMTHTLEVAQLSRTMARALGLNEDLVEAIALGHDLGHTPFGHLGEVVLDTILQGRDTLGGLLTGRPLGGFKHNYQSLRIVDLIEQKYHFPGLNLTAPVREGILKHTRLNREQISYPALNTDGIAYEVSVATTMEGQIVAVADEVAQRTHDFEDGLRAELVRLEEVRALEIVRLVEQRDSIGGLLQKNRYLYRNRLINGLINLLVSDLIRQSARNAARSEATTGKPGGFAEEVVRFSDKIDPLQKELNKFIYQHIIYHPATRQSDDHAIQVIRALYRLYYKDTSLIPPNAYLFAGTWAQKNHEDRPRRIADFIAGMTDSFAIAEFERLQARGLPVPPVDLAALSAGRQRHGNGWPILRGFSGR